VAQTSSSVVNARLRERVVRLFELTACELLVESCFLGVVPFKFFDVPSSRNWSFCEVIEVVGSCPSFHYNSVGSLPVGSEFPFLRILLIS